MGIVRGMATRNILLSHYWTNPADGRAYAPGNVATVESDVAWRLANGGIGRYTDDAPSGGTSPGGGGTGVDGREVQLQNSGTHIQWRYTGQSSWTNLVPLSDLRGLQGVKGDRGEQGLQGIQGPAGSGSGGGLGEDFIARVTALEAGAVLSGVDGSPTA